MSPERRARNLTVMKALARTSGRSKNKENRDLLNNMALPFTFNHSTPMKNEQVTDLDVMDQESGSDMFGDGDMYSIAESNSNETVTSTETSNPEVVISKLYDLVPEGSDVGMDDKGDNLEEMEVIVTEDDLDNLKEGENPEAAWKSLEVLDGIAEYEFYRSLEHSKMYLSTSNLLEEIEADLPSTYSLAKPLNHTFHSLTSYRTVTRLARLDKNITCLDDAEKKDFNDVKESAANRMDRLQMEAMVQKAKIKQAEKALLLSRAKKAMEIENLESEKTLLLAHLRFIAATQEIEKIKLLGDTSGKGNFGQITISGMEFVVHDTARNNSEIFICTATEGENVQFSLNQTRIAADGKLYFDEPMKFQNLTKDFVIHVQLHRRIPKETKTPMKTSIMKKLKELTGVNTSHRSILESPSSSHGFACVACAQLRVEHITNRDNERCRLHFAELPLDPVMGDALMVRLKADFNTKTNKTGFLNVFKNTWHRRWYSQTGHFLNSWLYPEDQENEKPPIESIYLSFCRDLVKPADLEVCIRPNSFVLVSGPEKEDVTIYSADSNKEMIKWMRHLNLIIENNNLWKPNV
ncbi:hypothetical protein RUM43_004044 [Polyplax serrata]|uniref:PH domain-containing protein n=1 Tax=Polyplax serrata TaxID=468196 RepID=A0AAN8SAG9_POLSC